MVAGTSITYYLPTYSDPDGDTVILNSASAVFIVYDDTTLSYLISPSTSDGGYSGVLIYLYDGYVTANFSFQVIVSNLPPIFSAPLIDQTVVVGFSLTYVLPDSTDPEGGAVTITAV